METQLKTALIRVINFKTSLPSLERQIILPLGKLLSLVDCLVKSNEEPKKVEDLHKKIDVKTFGFTVFYFRKIQTGSSKIQSARFTFTFWELNQVVCYMLS